MGFGRGRRRGATSLKREPAHPAEPRWTAWKPWLRGLGVALVLAAVGFGLDAGIRALREPGAFPLRQVRVEGELRNLNEADLQPLAQAYLGQNFFVANLDELRTALAADPWVEEVAVRRGWPDTVEIRLRERAAFGYWGERGEMVDVNGHRFLPVAVRQSGSWPRLTGPEGREQALIKAWRDIRARLDPVGLTLVKLVQDERRAWWLTFDSGLEVYLGRERFDERLQRLAQFYPRVLAAQADRIAVVDLRYGNGFAVRWKTAPPIPAAG